MTRSRRVPIAAALLLLVLAASACTAGGQQAGGPSPEPGAGENDINPVPRDQLQDGGTLRWPSDYLAPNFNYHHLDGTDFANFEIVGALMPRAFYSNARGEVFLNPDLLSAAEITATAPNQVVTYRINPRAVWSDGTPITWRDFEAQWRALNGTNPAFSIASSNGYDQISSVAQGTDEREAVVMFANPYADWEGLFGPLYPASTNSDPVVFNEGWVDRPLVTAGPFRLDSIDRTAQTITLARNDGWWGRPAKLDRIIFRALEDDAEADALANGEIDFIYIRSNVNKFQRAQTTVGIQIRSAAGPNFNHITINGTSPVLRDVRVRQAIALGIDRQVIADALLGPLGVPTTTLGNHLFMTNQAGYQDNSDELGVHDPQRAAALLDEAGWRLEGDVRGRDGAELVLRLVIPTQVAASQQVAELVQGMLGQIGVRVAIEVVPSADQFSRYIIPGNYDLAPFGWVGTPFPISSTKSIYQAPRPGPDGELDVQQNFARVGSAQIDRLYQQATSELDPQRAIELANRIDALIWQQVHSLPLYQVPGLVGAKATLANFGARGFASVIYEDIGFSRG
ncbi:MAG: ABC transporter family substrate-binding protein [Egibacteraceae bacterium]